MLATSYQRALVLTSGQISAARLWIADCVFADVEGQEIAWSISDREVERAVRNHFEGGIAAFVIAGVER